MNADPFDALTNAEVGWHYSERGAAPTPEAVATTRLVHGILSAWTSHIRLIPGVGGGVMIESVVGDHDILMAVHADGVTLMAYGLAQGDRTYIMPDDALVSDIEAWLGRRRGDDTDEEITMTEIETQKAAEKARGEFLANVREKVQYWSTLTNEEREITIADRCDGVAFSILVLIDGMAGPPPLDLVMRAHEAHEKDGSEALTADIVLNKNVMLHDAYYGADQQSSVFYTDEKEASGSTVDDLDN